MRHSAVLLLFTVVALHPAAAGEGDTKPLTPRQAADEVLAAFNGRREAALRALGAKDRPDPWLVADELCFRGAHDAAEAFATAATRAAVEGLSAYVASRRGKEAATRGWDAAARMEEALRRRDWSGALKAAEAFDSLEPSVLRIRLAHGRGCALLELGRPAESTDALEAAASAARGLGWLRRASDAYRDCGVSASRGTDWPRALSAWTKRLGLAELLGDESHVAEALASVGDVHRYLHQHAEALDYYRRSLEIREALGDRPGVARVLMHLGNVHYARCEYASALTCYRRAGELYEGLRDEHAAAVACGNVGNVHASRGEYAEAFQKYRLALASHRALGDGLDVARTLRNIGNLHLARGEYGRALEQYQESLRRSEELMDRLGVATTLNAVATVHARRGEYEEALRTYQRSLRMKEALGDAPGIAKTLVNIGNLCLWRGKYEEAPGHYRRALEMCRAQGDQAGIASSLLGMGNVHQGRGEYEQALEATQRALEISRAIGDKQGVSDALNNIGYVHAKCGGYAKALESYRRSLQTREDMGDQRGVAESLTNIGDVHRFLGEYARALEYHHRSLDIRRTLGDVRGRAATLINIGSVYGVIGDARKALDYHWRASKVHEAVGDRSGVASSLGNVANAYQLLGDFRKASEAYHRALEIREEIGDKAGVARVLGNIAAHLFFQEDYPGALTHMERARAMCESVGDRSGVIRMTGNIGAIHVRLGNRDEAERHLRRAVREYRRLRVAAGMVGCLGGLARMHLEDGEAGRAILTAQRAMPHLERLLGGLGEEESASARSRHADVFAVGALAAAELREAAEMASFLESGRAGALLETLGGRRALRRVDLPEALLQAESEAKAAETRARGEYERAIAAGSLPDSQAKARALDEALRCVQEVHARIQREAKRQAGLFYPRAATLEEIQSWLEDGEALVLYGLCLDRALALVLTSAGEHVVSLGERQIVEAACEALRADDVTEDPSSALATLRELLVTPLELPESVDTVLVSPEGRLCYVPFGALFDDKIVACTPSGTTHVLLREEKQAPGRRVLALGDPDYGLDPDPGAVAIYRAGVVPRRLEETRIEAQAVGDVVLLGADACERKLREVLPQETRWHAVHLACHGLVDPERPTLSSLALTRVGAEDGFLTALEVLRMEVPADLAVLSACETARGKIVGGEGIVGLTRVFMYAGAPRVLCSLWKVDDQATRALMVKFYELWNPRRAAETPTQQREPKDTNAQSGGLGAAAALKAAQEYVASHAKWEHPAYWAAWVLWGLPD